MSAGPKLRSSLRLMRPAQWPILSIQLGVGMVLAIPATDQLGMRWPAGVDWLSLGSAWLIWVVLLNGGTLAFNSAYDRDTGPVAYLADPPEPPAGLAGFSLAGMVAGALLGWLLVGPFFGAVVAGCALLSVLYSHPATRWKSRPGMDLATNMLGYGLGTTVAGLSAGGQAPTNGGWGFAVGFGLLFGSFYPLTQIYQTAADRLRGDRTLTAALGVPRALVLALALALAAGMTLLAVCHHAGHDRILGLLAGAVVLWCGHLGWWLIQASKWTDARHERAMYHALGLWGLVDLALVAVWLVG